MEVESRGNVNAVGDNGKAIGPFQIWKNYWTDAAEKDPTLKAGGDGYDNCKGSGSIEYSKRVMQVCTYVFNSKGQLKVLFKSTRNVSFSQSVPGCCISAIPRQ